jgi:CRP-like cAMP-binding protein
LKAGEKSSQIFFIIKGQVLIMNKEGLFIYGILEEGSYFGDNSLLLDQPNHFSYYYNPHAPDPVQLLTIECDIFL